MVRPAPLSMLAVVIAALSGCDLSSSDEVEPARSAAPRAHHYSYAARVIRGWLLALERQDYDGAAYYFAPGAIIDQGHPYRLRDQSAARAFNASLPCRADLVDLRHERGTVLASFRLRRGPGGECSGVVKVRYTIRKGKFTEWRQLPSDETVLREGPGSARTGAMAVLREGPGSARTGAMAVLREGPGSARTGAMAVLREGPGSARTGAMAV
jgi:hypothetical protein